MCVQIASRHANGFAESDVDGSYSITGLPAGSYTVQFTGGCGSSGSVAPQYYKDEPGAGSADPLTLTAGTITTGIDAAMKPGAAITGVVTDPAGHRLTGVCVGVADQSDVLFGSDFFTDIEFTSGGRYRAVNLAPGLYQVEFGCGGGKYASHWFRVKAVTFSPDLISVPAGVTSGVSAVIRLGGAISGVVTDKAGHRVSFACVLVVDARTGAQVPSSIDQGFADNGRYKIAGLAPGRYKVQFYGCGRNYASQWYHGRSTERAADQVRVRPGHDTTGISAALAPGGSISGLVVARATGKPVRRVCVEAFDAATQGFNARLAPGGSISGTVLGGSPTNRPQIDTCVIVVPVSPVGSVGGFAVTRTDGTYTATGLPAGKYQVLFNVSGCEFGVAQFASQWYNGQPTEATADAVTVSIGATTSGIDATLQLFGGITGTVTGPGHTPVPGECVTAVAAGKDFAGTLPPEFAISSKTGSYSLVTLQPGTYKVKFTTGCGDSGFAKQWWQDAGSAPAPTVITVGAGATTTGIDAALTH